ncbi:hypothetical protein BH11PSE2_BH11PSE2_07450 [soil metagenome]
MISAVIATRNDEAMLVAALSPLVAAAVDGLVRELVVADAGSRDATLVIADEAGAVMVSGDLAAGCAAARGPWLLIVTPQTRLYGDWLEKLRVHIEGHSGRDAMIVGSGIFARPMAVLVKQDRYAKAGKPVAARKIRLQ